MQDFPVGPRLTKRQLDATQTLPLKPDAVTLTGQRVRLLPTDPARDAAALHAVSNGDAFRLGSRSVDTYDPEMLVWRYLRYGAFADAAAVAAQLEILCNAPDQRSFTLVETEQDHPVGIITLMANMPAHLKIEIGNVWIAPVMQGSGVIMEACALLLGHCFGLDYRRVEWKCDALNARSRRMALKLGFTFEGIQEYHYIAKGRNRDTAWYRILDREWPAVHGRLRVLLDRGLQR